MTSISSDLPPSMPARPRSRVLPYVVLLILAALVAGLVWYATRPVAMLVQGEAEAPRVDVSARVPGRVVELGADVGDRVERGGAAGAAGKRATDHKPGRRPGRTGGGAAQ